MKRPDRVDPDNRRGGACPLPLPLWVWLLALLAAVPARAQELRDQEQLAGGDNDLSWRGTSFVFEQSVSRNTLIKDTQLSYNPLYLHTYSLRPRWYFTDSLHLALRQDVILELTQPDAYGPYALYTERERIFALDTRLQLADPDIFDLDGTRLGAAGQVALPLNPASSAWRRVLVAGVKATVARDFPEPLQGTSFGLLTAYYHYFNLTNVALAETDIACTPALRTDGGIATSPSYCLGGSTLMSERLDAAVSARLQLMAELDLTASFTWIWVLATDLSEAVVETLGGEVVLPDNSATHWRYYTDSSLALGYLLSDSLHLALGVSALTRQLDPNGSRRNPLFNTDTLIFLAATVRLDALYLQLSGRSGTTVADTESQERL